MRIDLRPAWRCTLACSVFFLTACPGKLEDKERFLADAAVSEGDAGSDGVGACGDVVARIFVPSCAGTGCHGAMGPQQGLDLVSPGLAARVVGVSGTGCLAPLADPTAPETSLLYTKLSASPPCGAPMPLARPPLSEADVQCVLAWIAAQ